MREDRGGWPNELVYMTQNVCFTHCHYNPSLKEYARELRTETVSRAEKYLWKAVLSRKQTDERFLRQRAIDRFIVDFFCPEIRLVIEIDGSSHINKGSYDAYRENRLKSRLYVFQKETY